MYALAIRALNKCVGAKMIRFKYQSQELTIAVDICLVIAKVPHWHIYVYRLMFTNALVFCLHPTSDSYVTYSFVTSSYVIIMVVINLYLTQDCWSV